MSPLSVAQLGITGRMVESEFVSFSDQTASFLLLASEFPDYLKCAFLKDYEIVLVGLSFLPTLHPFVHKLSKAAFKQLFVVKVAGLLHSFFFDCQFGFLSVSLVISRKPLVEKFLFKGYLVFLLHPSCKFFPSTDFSQGLKGFAKCARDKDFLQLSLDILQLLVIDSHLQYLLKGGPQLDMTSSPLYFITEECDGGLPHSCVEPVDEDFAFRVVLSK